MKSRKLVVSPQAITDLAKAHAFIEDKSPQGAENVVRDINTQIIKIATLGMTGTNRDWISEGLRFHPVTSRKFSIYFRYDESTVYIVRIIHQKQDISQFQFELNKGLSD